VPSFPWDNETCSIYFKSSTLDATKLLLIPATNYDMTFGNIEQGSTEWAVDKLVPYTINLPVQSPMSFPYENGTVSFSLFMINVTLQRRPTYYMYCVIAPIFVTTSNVLPLTCIRIYVHMYVRSTKCLYVITYSMVKASLTKCTSFLIHVILCN
jgi:hypothetical protein